MANTYTKIYIQVVFAVSGRQNLLSKEHKEELHKYITGIITECGIVKPTRAEIRKLLKKVGRV